MDDKIKATVDAIRASMFVATNLEDVEGLLKLGFIEKGIFSRGSARLRTYLGCDCSIYEDKTSIREFTISQLFSRLTCALDSLALGSPYIWTFRPYVWLDQFQALGVEPLTWNYYSYTYWSSKLLQDRLLLKNADSVLKEHLLNKHRVLNRVFRTKYHPDTQKKGMVLSKPYSTGGSGVFFDSKNLDLAEDFVLRLEKKIENHIPICQVAFTDGLKTICYSPSIMIIQESDGHFDYRGGDFNLCHTVSSKIEQISKITNSVGLALAKAGFTGVYNCDYLLDVDTNEVYFAEVNPRNSGCSFLIDSGLADRHLNGDDEALTKMPTFLAFYHKVHGELPKNIEGLTKSDRIFSEKSNTAFYYHKAKNELCSKGEHDYHPPNGIRILEGELEGVECFDRNIISNSAFPTILNFEVEKYF